MATKAYLHMAEPTTGQSCQQVFDGGDLAGTQIQGCAQRAVAHLVRPQPDRLIHPRQTHVEARLIRRPKLHSGLSSTVEADA